MKLNDKYPKWADNITKDPTTSYIPSLDDSKSFFMSMFTSLGYTSANILSVINQYIPAISSSNWSIYEFITLDVILHSEYGDKIMSKWFSDLDIVTDGTSPTTEQLYRIRNVGYMLLRKYGHKWNELIGSLGPIKNQLEKYSYNPLDNFDRHEEIDITVDHTGTQKQTYDKKITEGGSTSFLHGESIDTDIDYTGKEKTTDTALQADNSQTTDNQVYAFNSASAVDTAKQTVSGKAKKTSELEFTTRKDSKSEDHSGTDVTTHGRTETISSVGQGDTRTDALQDVTDHDSHLYGNIGVTTSQQMLESELELRKNICYEEICKDILRFIAIPIY